MKKLCRSNTNRLIAGVCGGIAEFLNCNVTLVRIIFALLCLSAGGGLLLYILAAIIMPSPDEIEEKSPSNETEDRQIKLISMSK